jgi:surfactin synthase thioesterase subunit
VNWKNVTLALIPDVVYVIMLHAQELLKEREMMKFFVWGVNGDFQILGNYTVVQNH